MDNIYVLECWDFVYDFETTTKKQINLDDYIFFEIELRCGGWFIKGHSYIDKDMIWKSKDLSACGVLNEKELARFIVYANHYPASKGKWQSCKVSRFNNLHYSGDFYGRLRKLLDAIDKEEKEWVRTKGNAPSVGVEFI